VEATLVAAGVAIEHPLELGSHEAVKRTVAAGLGYGGMSRAGLTWELAAAGLRVLDAPWFRCDRAFYVVRHGGRGLSPPERALMALLPIDLAL
jgi:DNA-binding transcriptional LysR family regulator